MAQKFIINNNEIILGEVEFHFQLIQDATQHKNTVGGGRWHWDEEEKTVYFYGSSEDFGKVTKEQFNLALENSLLSECWKDCKIVFSQQEYFSDVLKENK